MNPTKIIELFDFSADKNTAKVEFKRLFEDKSMRVVTLYLIGADAYSVEGGEHKVNTKKIEESFDTQWNAWITDRILTTKNDFDTDPLFENSQDARENLRQFMNKCTPAQKREIADHFRNGLESMIQESDEAKVSRKNRHKAIALLEDSSLVLEHIPPVAQEPLRELIKTQKEALKKLDETDEKGKKEAEITKEIQTIKDDILSDPLARGIEDRIDATLDKCGDDRELRKKFAKELAVHFRDELMKRVNSNDPVLIESSKAALVLLKSPHIRDYLSTTDNEALKAFIEEHTKALEIQILEKRIQPLKDSITISVLEDTVEDELAKTIAELNQNPNLLEKKRELIRHYRDALIGLLQDPASIDAHREEALAHLESNIVVKSLPKVEEGELKTFVLGEKAKKIEKSVAELKAEIQKQPFSVEKSIRVLFAQPNCTEDQK